MTNYGPIVRWLLRCVIATILLAAAIGKSLDLAGFIDVLKTYQALHHMLLWPVAITLTAVELSLGIWLLSGWRLATGAMLSAILHAIYGVWLTIALVRGLELTNCGCFGVYYPRPLTWLSPLEDVLMVGLCYWLRGLAKA